MAGPLKPANLLAPGLCLILQLFASLRTNQALRTGAPALACMNLRPFHGLHRAKPASASQFFVSQSSLTYAPGQNVTVDIVTHSSERYFRGFIIQAYDPSSGASIGQFLPGTDSKPIEGCSAATHRNNLNKKHVSLTWLPPSFFGHRLPDAMDGLSSQWLGVRAPAHFSMAPIQPVVSVNVSRRQLASADGGGPHAQPEVVAAPPAGGATSAGNAGNVAIAQLLRQVRFRATCVVTYEEFYTGFESSDQSFDKFDYASSSPRPSV